MKKEIKKGDKFLCIKDYVMDEGWTAYFRGKTYESKNDECITDVQGDSEHGMHNDEDFDLHFKKVGEAELFYEITKNTILKYEMKDEFPEMFKPEFEVGKWYKITLLKGEIYVQYAKNGNSVVGFDIDGIFNNILNVDCECYSNYELADEETIKELFKAELIRRGYVRGNLFKSLNNNELYLVIEKNLNLSYLFSNNKIYFSGGIVYENGVFAKAQTLADVKF